MTNYHVYRADRKRKGGSACIYVNDNISSSVTNVDQLNSQCIEQVRTSLQRQNERILIGCIYRPPLSTTEYNDAVPMSVKSAKRLVDKKSIGTLMITGVSNHSDIDWSGRVFENLMHRPRT
jgi:hypothetical protein